MTKYQRAKKRSIRDKALKRAKLQNLLQECDNLDSVITFQHFIESYNKCKRNVAWKSSVQKYNRNAIVEMAEDVESLLSGKSPTYSKKKSVKKVCERGKERVIVPIIIRERVSQKVVCDYSLSPMLERTLIYDNGAGLKGKGVDFARKRLARHLSRAEKEYGNEFYALTFDFKDFYGSISHKACFDILNSVYSDKRIVSLIMNMIKDFSKSETLRIEDLDKRNRVLYDIDNNLCSGLPMGSQISQIMALTIPSKMDHYIKDYMGVKYYVRYMDDGVILHNDKEYLRTLYNGMAMVCKKTGLRFNERKTKIVKISKGFTFLKIRYRLTDTGKIVHTLSKCRIVRMRRRLKKLHKLCERGIISIDEVCNSLRSWLSHAKSALSYKTRKRMMALFYELFGRFNNGRCVL